MITQNSIEFTTEHDVINERESIVRGKIHFEAIIRVDSSVVGAEEMAKRQIANRTWQYFYGDLDTELSKLESEIARIRTAIPGDFRDAMHRCKAMRDLLKANWIKPKSGDKS